MSRSKFLIAYWLGLMCGALIASKPFLSDRWILLAFLGAILASFIWAGMEKLDQLKRGTPRKAEPIEPTNIDRTCPTCKGGRTVGLLRHGKMQHVPCYTCKGSGWQKLNPPNAA